MSELIIGQQTTGVAYFCPKCGSPSVNVAQVALAGAPLPASCNACRWDGDSTELVAAPFKHEFKSDEEIINAMMVDLRGLLAKTAAQTYGAFLLKWGLLDQPITTKQLALYISEIAKAVAVTALQTRKKMREEADRERAGG